MPPKTLAERYYDYRATFPFLDVLKENHQALVSELMGLHENDWVDWLEKDLYTENLRWQVFPFLGLGQWFDKNGARCPKTYEILKSLPEQLKTATYSRVSPNSALRPHQGWGRFANSVLRCHYGLIVPDGSGVWVEGEERLHREGEIVVFDDSKQHSGFNRSDRARVVLLMDIERPSWVPQGSASSEYVPKLSDLLEALS